MDDCTLDELHDIIQTSMGWGDEHVYSFVIDGEQYGDIEGGDDAHAVRLSDFAKQGSTRFHYEYDLGDNWRHTIEIEKTMPAEEGVYYPRCVQGAHEKNCVACHATFAYLMARPALPATSSAHRKARVAADAKLNPKKTPPLRVSQTVMAAAALAQHDAATGSTLQPITRQALDRIWDLQREDGGWNWVKKNQPPSEIDDHFGVTMAVIGVGMAPDHYAESPQARKGLEGIRRYLREHPPTTMHQRAMLLLAGAHVEGLLTDERSRQTVADLFTMQRPDGGWAMAGLGNWKRADSSPQDHTVSDGYGTGFAVYALRRGGKVAANDARLQKGVLWLKTHQRASGRWHTRSPYKNDELSTYVGTAYAVLALDAAGEILEK